MEVTSFMECSQSQSINYLKTNKQKETKIPRREDHIFWSNIIVEVSTKIIILTLLETILHNLERPYFELQQM